MRFLPQLLRKSNTQSTDRADKNLVLTYSRYCAVLVVFLGNLGGSGVGVRF